jgi:hypothetical protein
MKTTILTLLAGIVLGGLLFFATVFKLNGQELLNYVNEYDLTVFRGITPSSSLSPNYLNSNYSSDLLVKGGDRILKSKFEDSINRVVSKDPEFLQNLGYKGLPVDDAIVLASRKILYHKIEQSKKVRSRIVEKGKARQEVKIEDPIFNKNSWFWISKEELFDYVYALFSAPKKDSIDGCRVYFGIIDKNFVDANHYNKGNNKLYYEKKHGTLVTYFVTTNSKGGMLNDDPTRAKYDCNCGNPPTCDVDHVPGRRCRYPRIEPCERYCPEP